jgi:hypothetical protein
MSERHKEKEKHHSKTGTHTMEDRQADRQKGKEKHQSQAGT